MRSDQDGSAVRGAGVATARFHEPRSRVVVFGLLVGLLGLVMLAVAVVLVLLMREGWVFAALSVAGLAAICWAANELFLRCRAMARYRIVVTDREVALEVPASMAGPRSPGARASVPLVAIARLGREWRVMRWSPGYEVPVMLGYLETRDGVRHELGCWRRGAAAHGVAPPDAWVARIEAVLETLSGRTGLPIEDRGLVVARGAPGGGPQAFGPATSGEMAAAHKRLRRSGRILVLAFALPLWVLVLAGALANCAG